MQPLQVDESPVTSLVSEMDDLALSSLGMVQL